MGLVADCLRRWFGLYRYKTVWHFCETPDEALVFSVGWTWGWYRGVVHDALQRHIGTIYLHRQPRIWLTFPQSQPTPWKIHNRPAGWEIEVVRANEPLRKLMVTGLAGDDSIASCDYVNVWLPPELDDEPFIKMLLLTTAVLQLHNNITSKTLKTISGIQAC
jgi:hypothetical protein